MFFVQMMSPGVTSLLMFVPSEALVHPWTVVTYMFLHGGFGHIFFNMLALYFFGPPVEQRMGGNRFITLYLLSGIVGALFSIVLRVPVIGASGAVMGVSLAFARFWPRQQILIWGVLPIEARWLVILYAAIDIL